MKAAVVSLGSTSSKWTIDAMKSYFDEVDDLDIRYVEISFSGKKEKILYKGKPIRKYDCVFAKGSFRYANLLKSITLLLRKEGTYLPIADSAFTVAHDKLLTQLEFEKSNIPMPTTYLASTIEAARSILERLNYPIVMKFPQGTQGKGVLFAESFASASSILDALSSLKQPFIIQEYMETDGTDIRAFVVGDKVVAAFQRKANVKEIRANVHAGGKGSPIELDDETKRMAVKAAKSLDAGICGVDILQTHKGSMVLEVNISPSLQGITKYTGINVADRVAKYLYTQTKKEKESKHSEVAEKIMTDNIEQVDKEQTLITSLDYRGSRVLLPEVITKAAGMDDDSDYEMIASKGKVVVKKFDI